MRRIVGIAAMVVLTLGAAGCFVPGGPTPPAQTALPDDLEGVTSGWTATGLWHLVDDSPCGGYFGFQPHVAYTSATHAFYYGHDDTCQFGTQTSPREAGTLTSPNYVGVTGKATFTVESWKVGEGLGCDPELRTDFATIEASYDGGTTWVSLDPCVPDRTNDDFEARTYAIHPTGDTLRLRFTFDSNVVGGHVYPGWIIDDLSVG